ncbi:MAG TPA: LysR family transcriptional regulator [Gemmatimonadaceae bacterium]|nr:LysR family transcriptional regulator [Gemmatimonadaceae bacterium]
MPTTVARKSHPAPRTRPRATKSARKLRGETAPALIDGRVGTRVKGWLTWDGEFFVGPRYIRLLEAVGVAGTITGACESCGMSYRTCINRIRQMERTLGAPILEISRGGAGHGSARLTPLAQRLVCVYYEWHREIVRASDSAARRLLRD